MPDNQNTKDEREQTSTMYFVETIMPRSPRPGSQWFNPATGKLKIYRDTRNGWQDIN